MCIFSFATGCALSGSVNRRTSVCFLWGGKKSAPGGAWRGGIMMIRHGSILPLNKIRESQKSVCDYVRKMCIFSFATVNRRASVCGTGNLPPFLDTALSTRSGHAGASELLGLGLHATALIVPAALTCVPSSQRNVHLPPLICPWSPPARTVAVCRDRVRMVSKFSGSVHCPRSGQLLF